jgi:2-iminobutanoate/2-iminopropanoate deaminase
MRHARHAPAASGAPARRLSSTIQVGMRGLRNGLRSAVTLGINDMRKSFVCAALALLSFAVLSTVAPAQTFEKKNYNYSEWTKGRFSEAVTVIGPGKMIFLAGIGSEDENGKGGDILYKGDFTAQCKYAFDKIKRALDKNGATLGDIAKMVTYMTDVRYQAEFGKCRQDAFGTTPMPAHTLLTISQLAWPGMLIEIDVTAVVPLK